MAYWQDGSTNQFLFGEKHFPVRNGVDYPAGKGGNDNGADNTYWSNESISGTLFLM
jgi:hypothetical protein